MSRETDNGGFSPDQEETMEQIQERAADTGKTFEEAAQDLGTTLVHSAKDMRQDESGD